MPASRRRLWTPGVDTQTVQLSTEHVVRLIPHRPPFLFVETITALDLAQQTIQGWRRLDSRDPVFTAHFPGHPVYPAVLQIEALAQLGLCLLYCLQNGCTEPLPARAPLNARAVRIREAAFLEELRPGDRLELLAEVADADTLTATLVGQVLRDDAVCSYSVCEVLVVDG